MGPCGIIIIAPPLLGCCWTIIIGCCYWTIIDDCCYWSIICCYCCCMGVVAWRWY